MADDKKNIPDTETLDKSPKPGKVEPVKADSPVQDQPAPAKAEAPVIEDASKVITPPAAEQPAPAGEEAPKGKDAPVPSKEGTPQPGKDEKQTTIPGMGDPALAGKVVDFTAARDGATKGKPPEKAAAPDKDKQADKAKDAAKPRRGRPPKADKAAPDKAKPQPRDKMSQSKPPAGKGAPAKAEAPAATEQPPAPRDAARGVKEEIVYLNLAELHPFKNHPFGVRDDAEMQGLVESVKAAGVNQPALVRPREGGGYEIMRLFLQELTLDDSEVLDDGWLDYVVALLEESDAQYAAPEGLVESFLAAAKQAVRTKGLPCYRIGQLMSARPNGAVYFNEDFVCLDRAAFERICQTAGCQAAAVKRELSENGYFVGKTVNRQAYETRISVRYKDGASRLIRVYKFQRDVFETLGEPCLFEGV